MTFNFFHFFPSPPRVRGKEEEECRYKSCSAQERKEEQKRGKRVVDQKEGFFFREIKKKGPFFSPAHLTFNVWENAVCSGAIYSPFFFHFHFPECIVGEFRTIPRRSDIPNREGRGGDETEYEYICPFFLLALPAPAI